jgi:toxin YoeB
VNVRFTPRGWTDYRSWIDGDLKTLAKIMALIEDARRSPLRGLGKPEPLKEDLAGWWSRRIDDEHRLVYRVTGQGEAQQLQIAQCRGRY